MWITESNRLKHFIYAIPLGILFTIIFVIGIAFGMEIKDKMYGNKFDWLDLVSTILGGIIGQLFQIYFIWCLGR